MKVHVQIPLTANLNSSQVKKVALNYLQSIFDIDDDMFIGDTGDLMLHHDTHGSGFDEEIREATDDDKLYFKIRDTIWKKERGNDGE